MTFARYFILYLTMYTIIFDIHFYLLTQYKINQSFTPFATWIYQTCESRRSLHWYYPSFNFFLTITKFTYMKSMKLCVEYHLLLFFFLPYFFFIFKDTSCVKNLYFSNARRLMVKVAIKWEREVKKKKTKEKQSLWLGSMCTNLYQMCRWKIKWRNKKWWKRKKNSQVMIGLFY